MGVLTPRALEVLRTLAAADEGDRQDDDGYDLDLMVEGWTVYLGLDRIHRSTFNRLIVCGAVRQAYDDGPYWVINDTGRAIARRPELADEVFAAYQRGRGSFSIIDDQLVAI